MTGLGAFVITHERPHVLRRTIEAIDEQSIRPEVLWVVDNSSGQATRDLVAELGRQDVRYWPMGHNAGPAGAAARGLQLLREEGYDWAYWVDDDDPPPFPDTLARLLALIEAHKEERLGGVAAVGQRFSWSSGVVERLADEDLTEGPREVDVIGGGQQFIVSVEAAHAVGYPCADLFFGCEELEFCLRLRMAGWRLMIDAALMRELRQRTGRTGFVRRRRVVPVLLPHAHWREYYVNRNYIHAMRTTFRRPDLARRWALRGAIKTAASWLKGAQYGASYTQMALRGIWDGYRGRLGLTVPPQAKPGTS
jgi:glycosyltransferase involved in cell wall biosynthesis